MCLWKPQLGRPITGFTFREKPATLPGILPIGLNCFVVAGVSRDLQDAEGRSLEVPLQDVFRGIGPFFVADVATVAVLLAFPGIVLWLSSPMG